MRLDEDTGVDTGVVQVLRRDPALAGLLLRITAVAAIALVAWDIGASLVLPVAAVKAIDLLLLIAYGAAMTYVVTRSLSPARRQGSTRLSSRGRERNHDLDVLRRRPDELEVDAVALDREEAVPEPAAPAPPMGSTAFNQSYFLMRLQEQVKDARRHGHDMCVVAVHVTVPSAAMTAEVADVVAADMARLAAEQSRLISQPLSLSDCEFVFSLPNTDADAARQLARDIMRAFGDFWCYFGVAAFPRNATDAQGLVAQARAACEASLQSGKSGRVEYPAA